MYHLARRAVLLAVLAPAVALTAPTLAQADTLTVTHDSDPVENVAYRVNIAYSTSVSDEFVYATIKPSGGAGCGPDFAADQGQSIAAGDAMQGSGTDTIQVTEPQGAYVVCAYEQQADDQTGSDAPVAASTITVRQIYASLSLGAPATAKANVPFALGANYTVEQQRALYVSYAKLAPGAGCPQASGLTPDGWQSAIEGDSVQGAGRDSADVTLGGPGTYLFCGWVEQGYDDSSPAAVAATTVTVSGPAPVASPPQRSKNAGLPKLPTGLGGGAGLQVRPFRVSFTGDGTGFLGGFTGHKAARRPSRTKLGWAGRLRWTQWTATQGRARGVEWLNNGIPDDAKGTFHPSATQVRVYRPRNGVFTRLTFSGVYRRHRVTESLKARYVANAYGSYWSWN